MNFKMATGEDFTINTKGGYTLTAPDKTGTLATVGDIPADKVEIIISEEYDALVAGTLTELENGTYRIVDLALSDNKLPVIRFSKFPPDGEYYNIDTFCVEDNREDGYVMFASFVHGADPYIVNMFSLNDDDTIGQCWNVNLETTSYKVTSLSSSSTDTQYPSAKCVYDELGTKQNIIDSSHKLDYSLLDNTPTIPTVPTISTNIQTDKTSDTKTASPKATYDEIHPATGSSQPSGGMLPNKHYKLGTLTGTVTFTLASPTDSNIDNYYFWSFSTDTTAPTITWPSSIISWYDGSAPTINPSKYYEVIVIDGVGSCKEV